MNLSYRKKASFLFRLHKITLITLTLLQGLDPLSSRRNSLNQSNPFNFVTSYCRFTVGTAILSKRNIFFSWFWWMNLEALKIKRREQKKEYKHIQLTSPRLKFPGCSINRSRAKCYIPREKTNFYLFPFQTHESDVWQHQLAVRWWPYYKRSLQINVLT